MNIEQRFESYSDRTVEKTRFKGLELPDASPRGKHTPEQKAADARIANIALPILALMTLGACFI